ncbi:helix-turn-helix domain-containing protein [Nonlabens sp. Asnod2-A12]|uniref:helix-turn-helix domain-containing protein n=1 Tax=Nonlabens sp. Asnod2-A12 TaxID=3160578 RepID=UPI00386F71D8
MNSIQQKNKFQIIENFNIGTSILSDNSMGIYIKLISNQEMDIHFKPLNETFKSEAFNENSGILINFKRDLIEEDDIEYALDVMYLFNKYPQFKLTAIDEVLKVKNLTNLLKEEYNRDGASYIMIKTLLKVLILHFIRYQNNEFLKQDLNQKRVFQFLELMETHYLNEQNPDYYAVRLGISLKRLNQILQEKLSLTARQVIQQRLITEAKRLLIKGELSIKEISYLLSFESIGSFSRFFKKNVGHSPTAFKSDN